jgi:hypothetical protein
MGNLLFIDSDDINGLSDALRNALERRGVRFRNGGFDFPTTDDEIPDIDPFYGNMPDRVSTNCYDESHRLLFQESGGNYGGCGGHVGGCGGYVEHRSSCGGHVCSSCGGGGCGGYSYPRC